MTRILVSQKVVRAPETGERLDALDQRWAALLGACGLVAVPVPNDPSAARALFETSDPAGILLTGGNDLAAYGGDAPERDETEFLLLDMALDRGLTCLGVCRGMQVIQHRYGVPLDRVDGHVAEAQKITVDGAPRWVNSYHRLGTRVTVPELRIWATAPDGTVKAVSHREHPVHGFMWHPERMEPFDPGDRAFIARTFNGTAEE